MKKFLTNAMQNGTEEVYLTKGKSREGTALAPIDLI